MSHDEVSRYWAEESEKIKRIKSLGAEKYFGSITNIQDAFVLSDKSLRCIDEGTPGGIHLAGSGILLNFEEVDSILKEAEIDGLYSHEECGAAKLFAKQEGLDPKFADEYCEEWLKSLAERTKIPYGGRLGLDQMERPAGGHIASVAYYDATGQFNYAKLDELPRGFVISRKYLKPGYAQKEVGIAVSIALGDHGFGDRFSKDMPFFLIIITSEDQSSVSPDVLKAELEPVASKYNGRVKVLSLAADSLLAQTNLSRSKSQS